MSRSLRTGSSEMGCATLQRKTEETMDTQAGNGINGIWKPVGVVVFAFAVAFLAGGCELAVSNPGPVEDKFLDNRAAFAAMVNGSEREYSLALVNIGVNVAVRTRELHAGSGNSFLNTPLEAHLGEPADPDEGDTWNPASHAVWLAESAVDRMKKVLETSEFESNRHVAEAYLWAGYSNRLLADFFCQVLWDGGAPKSPEAGFERAEEQFTRAMQIASAAGASDVVTSARAGRASVRVLLRDWSGAVEDAREVPTDFVHEAHFFKGEDWRRVNGFYEYGRGINRAFTVWNTPFEDYYESTGDPRTPWRTHPDWETTSGTLEPWGGVLFYQQQKYPSQTSPIEITSGREMRLIEAEAQLRNGDISGAISIINNLRTTMTSEETGEPLEPVEASSEEEAWAALKFERMIELWMEGRRLGDRRRWKENGTPGALKPEELGTTRGGPDLSEMVYCIRIPNPERRRNSNLEEM